MTSAIFVTSHGDELRHASLTMMTLFRVDEQMTESND